MPTRLFFVMPASILLGILSGLSAWPWLQHLAEVCTTLFLRYLQLISLPLIFLALLSTLSQLSSWEKFKNMGRRILFYTLLTTLLAATVALCLFWIMNPVTALSTTLLHSDTTYDATAWHYFIDVVPTNFLVPFLNHHVLSVAFLGCLLGFAVITLPEKHQATLTPIFDALFNLFLQLAKIIIYIMPLGIWAFTTAFFFSGPSLASVSPILWYTLCVLSANLIQGLIVLPILLITKKISPVHLVKAVWPALVTAFFSKSSNGALPLTMDTMEKKLHINPKITRTTLPLCTIINMNGCAAFILITVLFVSGAEGLTFSPLAMVGWIFLSTVAAIGNAGVPMGCYFLASAFLMNFNVPLTLMGLILPIYAFIDMVETTLNVWSDCCITAIIHKAHEAA